MIIIRNENYQHESHSEQKKYQQICIAYNSHTDIFQYKCNSLQKHIDFRSVGKRVEMTLIIIHEVLPKMCRMQQFESLPFLEKDIIFHKNAIPNVYFEFG